MACLYRPFLSAALIDPIVTLWPIVLLNHLIDHHYQLIRDNVNVLLLHDSAS